MVKLKTLQVGEKFKMPSDSTVYTVIGSSMDNNQTYAIAPYRSPFSTWSERLVVKISQ
jgi:hypothetical protein